MFTLFISDKKYSIMSHTLKQKKTIPKAQSRIAKKIDIYSLTNLTMDASVQW